jgi:DNA-3-methyladenine glycosylase I
MTDTTPAGTAPPSDPPAGARCFGEGDPVYEAYHDEEWGRPRLTERELYERLCLEGVQSGLSWRLVLGRREAYRRAFAGFDPDVVAGYDEREVARLAADPALIRSRRKMDMIVTNARATLALREAGGLPALVAAHAPPERPAPGSHADVPASTLESRALAGALKGAGFTFVGPTTAYALMQAVGIVDDHLVGCPVRAEVEAARAAAGLGRTGPATACPQTPGAQAPGPRAPSPHDRGAAPPAREESAQHEPAQHEPAQGEPVEPTAVGR